MGRDGVSGDRQSFASWLSVGHSSAVDLTYFTDLITSIEPVDGDAAQAAMAHHLQLTKPPGSLGQLEDLGVQLAAIGGSPVPPAPEPAAIAVFAGDHGVLAEGVSPWPQEVTTQMVMNFCAGGAAINAIAEANDIRVKVVNAGVAGDLPDHPNLLNKPIRKGTANLLTEPAMTRDDAVNAILLGAGVAAELIDDGARCLLTGDMGIGNTTPSATIIAALTNSAAAEITGRGTGIDDATLALKTRVVNDALARVSHVENLTAVDLLAEVGGLEIAALCGFCLGAAANKVPLIVDGVIALAGALTAVTLAPNVLGYLIAGHRSVEPAASAALHRMGLDPLIDLHLRLGEGSGAALAYPLVRAAAKVMSDMATFESAGIDGSEPGE